MKRRKEFNLSLEEKKLHKAIYKQGDRLRLRELISNGTLCAVVQKWIIQKGDLTALLWMKESGFNLHKCLRAFYYMHASKQMKLLYNP